MAFWIPFAVNPLEQRRDGMACMAVGRLRPGVSVQQARGELEGIAGRLAEQFPETNAGRGVRVVPVSDYVLGRAGNALVIGLIATGLVVLIACANLANLLLARSAGRAREIGIRLAMGASRSRLVRQGLTETLLLALAGGALGVVFAAASRGVLVRLAPAGLPGLDRVQMDPAVLGFAVGLSALAGLVVGVGPAWRSSRLDPQTALAGARGSIGVSRGRTRHLLVVSEVALSVLLTVGAGLLVKSFTRLLAVDPAIVPGASSRPSSCCRIRDIRTSRCGSTFSASCSTKCRLCRVWRRPEWWPQSPYPAASQPCPFASKARNWRPARPSQWPR